MAHIKTGLRKSRGSRGPDKKAFMKALKDGVAQMGKSKAPDTKKNGPVL